MKFVVLAGTLTGNRGAEAMVATCLEQLRSRHPDAAICVASYYPREDAKALAERRDGGVEGRVAVYSCTPMSLILRWTPMALAAKLPGVRKGGRVRSFGGIRDLLDADAVLDVAGVSFIDGREKFLPFNVLTLFPFLLHRIPVVKMPQAMGPLRSPLNRWCAKRVLPRLHRVYARGRRTLALLDASGIRMSREVAPDISFLLEGGDGEAYAARKERTVAVLPSSLVWRKHPGYLRELAELIVSLRERGVEVTLVTHSWRESERPRNNDVPAAEALNRLLDPPAPLKGPGLDARGLRREIARHRVAVTSRFHGMIGALETATPVLVVGWSHKYLEVLEAFGFGEELGVDYRAFDGADVLGKVTRMLEHGEEVSGRIAERLPGVREAARRPFDELAALVTEREGE